jgi:hypothetical protein
MLASLPSASDGNPQPLRIELAAAITPFSGFRAWRGRQGRRLLGCRFDPPYRSMAVTGGTCEFYEPTDAAHITCIADLQHWDAEHPNMVKVPSNEDVELIEGQLSGLVVEEERPPTEA